MTPTELAAAAKTRYLWACHVACAAFFADDPNAADAERNATRAHDEWRAAVAAVASISVDESNNMLHDQDMGSEHIEQAILKLEALRDEQLAAGDTDRAARTMLEIERMERTLVYV